MTHYVLDTDILTLFQKGQAAVIERVQRCEPDALSISIISVEEELRGWYTKLRRAKKPAQLATAYQQLTDTVRFFARLRIFSFTEPAIARYNQLRSTFRTIGKNDLRIAAIALENNAVVATRNVKDFRQVPGLLFEDWTK